MKKILAILISVLLLLNTTAIVFAEEDITIDVQFNEETKEFTISGYIKYERDRIPVALYMTHENGNTVSITETIATAKRMAAPSIHDVDLSSGWAKIVSKMSEKNAQTIKILSVSSFNASKSISHTEGIDLYGRIFVPYNSFCLFIFEELRPFVTSLPTFFEIDSPPPN